MAFSQKSFEGVQLGIANCHPVLGFVVLLERCARWEWLVANRADKLKDTLFQMPLSVVALGIVQVFELTVA